MSQNQKIWNKQFLSLFFTNMSVFFVFYGLVNVLPIYVTSGLKRGSEDAGLLLTIFLLSAIVARPFIGKILDVVGKRKMLVMSMVGYFVTTILYVFIKPFVLLLVLRFIQGIFFSVLTTANNAIAADTVPMEKRGRGLGYFAMSQNLAIVLGSFVALLLIQYVSFDALFWVMSAILLIGSALVLTLRITEHEFPEGKPKLTFKMSDLIEKGAVPFALIGLFVAFSYSGVLSFLAVYAKEKGVLAVASFFYVVFAAAMLLSRPFTGRMFDTKGPNSIIMPGFILFAIGLLCMAWMPSAFVFLLAGALIGLGYGALVPSFQTLSVQKSPARRTSYATATFFTFFDIGIALGSFILGSIAAHKGYATIYLVAGAVILIVGVFYILNTLRKGRIATKQQHI